MTSCYWLSTLANQISSWISVVYFVVVLVYLFISLCRKYLKITSVACIRCFLYDIFSSTFFPVLIPSRNELQHRGKLFHHPYCQFFWHIIYYLYSFIQIASFSRIWRNIPAERSLAETYNYSGKESTSN
jgi:hypothetical protein